MEASQKAQRISTSQTLSAAAWRGASLSVSRSEVTPMSAPPPASVAARASSTMNHLSRTFTIDSSDTPCEAALADQLMLTAEDLIGSGQVDPVYRGLLQSGPDAGADAGTALA